MKSKLTNFISLAVVMFVLTAVFTVSALADITGGFGVIENLDTTKTYEAASVTLNAAGNGYTEGTAFELNDTTNKDLAGLYIVWEKGNKETTKTDIIYVIGSFAGRQAIFNKDTTNNIATAYAFSTADFTVGKVSVNKGRDGGSNNDTNIMSVVVNNNYSYLSAKFPTGAEDRDNYKAEFDTKSAELKAHNYKYALDTDEIINISEVEQFVWYFNGRYSCFEYPGLTPQFVAYVMKADGTVTKHTYTHTTAKYSAKSDTARSDLSVHNKMTVSFENGTANGSWDTVPTEGWFVGFQVYPFIGLDNYEKVTPSPAYLSRYKKADILTYFDASKYTIVKPTQPAPTGLSVEGLAVKGLDDTREYIAIPVIDGVANPDEFVPISGVKKYTFAVGSAAFWDICYAATDYFAQSEGTRIELAKKDAPVLTMSGNTVSGFDKNQTYYLVSFNVNGADRANKIELPAQTESYTFDVDTQVGLWAFYSKGDETGMDSELSELVYIEGKWKDRENIFDPNPNYVAGTNYGLIYATDGTNSKFIPGKIVLPGSTITHGRNQYAVAFGYSSFASDFNASGISESSRKQLFDAIVPEFKTHRYAYGFNNDEIIPISEVVSYTWALAERYMAFGYKNLVSKFVAHIADENGNITEYEYLHTGKDLTSGFSGDNITSKLSNNDTYNKKVDFTKQESESGKWTTALPTEGYLVGFEIFPLYGMTEYENVSGLGTTWQSTAKQQISIYVYNNPVDYVITAKKAETPSGLVFENNTVTGFKDDVKYLVVPYDLNGPDYENPIELDKGTTSYTFDPATQPGLWGICIEGDDYNLTSDPSELFYVYGKHALRQEIGTFAEGSEIPNASAKGDYKWVKGKFIVTASFVNGKAKKESDNSYSFHQDNMGLGKNDADYSALNEELAKETPDEAKVKEYKANILAKFSDDYVTYMYNNDEIIPASDLEKMTIGVGKPQGLIGYFKPSITFFVMDKNGEITEYTWKSAEIKGGLTNTGVNKFTADLTTVLPQESDKWEVGFEIRSLGGMTADELILPTKDELDRNAYLNNIEQIKTHFYFERDAYKIDAPKADAPTGLTVEDTTVSGLNPELTYAAVPYTIKGDDIDNQIEIPAGNTKFTFPDDKSGIWGITVKGDDYNYNSDPSELFYIAGPSAKRQELGNFTQGAMMGDVPLADFNFSNKDFVVGMFTGSGSNAGKAIANAHRYLAQPGLAGDAQKLWLYDNTKEKVQELFDKERTEEVKDKEKNNGKHMQDVINKFYDNSAATQHIDVTIAGKDETTIKSERDALANNIKNALSKIVLYYAYSSDEIIHVEDLYTFTYALHKDQGGIFVEDAKAKLTFSVMNKDRSIDTYSTISNAYDFTNNSQLRTITVDVQSIENWPTEGWIVGFKLEPFYEVDANNIYSGPGVNNSNSTLVNDDVGTRFHASQLGMCIYYTPKTYVIKADAPAPTLASFPIIAGGYGQISGLNPEYEYEYRFLSNEEGAEWTSWSDIPPASTAMDVTVAGTYEIRAKNTEAYGKSEAVQIVVGEYESLDPDVLPYTHEIAKMHLPNDFVELKAEYEMDITIKNWVSSLALENIKTLSPESTITFVGENHKIVLTAANVKTDEKVHYYNMDVSLFGESRFNAADIDKYKELAGENYISDVYFESSNGLPFEEGQLMIKLGEKYDGLDVELNTYNEKINRLRLVEASTVYDGWVTFTKCEDTYVIVIAD